jgi:hypothetical protein
VGSSSLKQGNLNPFCRYQTLRGPVPALSLAGSGRGGAFSDVRKNEDGNGEFHPRTLEASKLETR